MEKYQELEKIGEGQFGVVRKIKRISDGKVMAWKEIQYGSMSRDQKNQLVNQVNILKDLNNDNIVKYYGHIIDKKNSKIYILMEHCPGGDLGSVLKQIAKKKQYLDQDLIWKLLFQLVTALHYCHRKKILHRDLKPANIFIDSSRSNIKIGDFGLSKQLGEHSEYAKTYVGTPYYMSPEQVNNTKYNQKSDIWSLGCILYELSTMTRPFIGNSIIELGKNIQNGKFKPLPNRYSIHLQNIIGKMLSVNPDLRPNTIDLLNLPYIKIRVEQKQVRQRYQQLKRREEIIKKQEEEYRQKIKALEGCSVTKIRDEISKQRDTQRERQTSKLKKARSILDANKGRILKSMTISL